MPTGCWLRSSLSPPGVHGTELRSERGGAVDTLSTEIPPELIQAMTSIASIASGILVEQKGCGIAVHYRNAPPHVAALEIESSQRSSPASSYDLVLREGRKVLEAVPSGFSKGTALTGADRAASVQGPAPGHDRR